MTMVAGAPLGSIAGHGHVGRHDRVDPGVDRGLEGRQVDRVELLAAVRHLGQAVVAVGAGVTVAREVLGDRGDAALVEAVDLGGDDVGDRGGVGAGRADPDDRVVGVEVDVGDRRVVLGHADRGRARSPITSADRARPRSSRPAPSAILPGIWVAPWPEPKRATSAPPSWSTAMLQRDLGPLRPARRAGDRWRASPPGPRHRCCRRGQPAQDGRVVDDPAGLVLGDRLRRACRPRRAAGCRPSPRRSPWLASRPYTSMTKSWPTFCCSVMWRISEITRPRYGASPERPRIAGRGRRWPERRGQHQRQADDQQPERCPGAAGGGCGPSEHRRLRALCPPR